MQTGLRAIPLPVARPQTLRVLARKLLPLAAATLALGAAAQNSNTVTAWSNAGQVFDLTETTIAAQAGNAAPIDMATWGGGESQFAVASAATLTLRAVAATRGDSYASGAQHTTLAPSAQLHDPIAGGTTWSGGSNGDQACPGAFPAPHVLDIDTGLLSLSFNTLVGNRIGFEGELIAGICCSTYSPTASSPSCAGLSGHGSTFDGELSTNLAGVGFGDYTPGALPPVPEPATWTLKCFGVALLLRRVRGAGALPTRAGR